MTTTAYLDVGDVNEIGFVFRNGDGELVTPEALTVAVRSPGEAEDVELSEASDEVELGATLGAVLAAELGLTDAENTAGTGIVRVLYPVDAPGVWWAYCAVTAPFVAAESVRTVVRPPFTI
jgi:hypothetical protein